MSQQIDARGKACPIPVVLARGAISQGESAFTVRVDNPTAVENLKRLADNQGYTAQETAEILGENPSTVRTWLVQARKKLKERWEAEHSGRS